ncbi:MAG: trypsin-like peptidase domain-containing protein [Nitrososphaerales archaeon]
MDNPYEQNKSNSTLIVIVAVLLIGLFSGGFFTYMILAPNISYLQNEVRILKKQILNYQPIQNINVYQNLTSLSEIYQKVKDSVVIIRGFTFPDYAQVEGSGFVYNYSGSMFIITNFHVVHDVFNITVTFSNGNSYRAIVRGFDAYVDLAVLELKDAPQSEFKPLNIVSSSKLKVGDPIIAVGNPFGLTGSMTTGIVSQLGRSISESITGGFRIANVIQISAPINPGNSGGPLLNYAGNVVGITTAIVADSQGVGFAIPSDTILREIPWLIETGSYNQHSWMGLSGIDMNYEIAEAMNVNITYGWLICQVVPFGPAQVAGLRGGTTQVEIAGQFYTIGGDIIVAINGTKIVNGDDLSSYLDAKTLPGDVIILTIVRNNQLMNVTLTLGTRPPPPI